MRVNRVGVRVLSSSRLALYLLASTSALAISTAAQAACTANPATPFTNSGTISCITFNDALSHVGNVTNAGSGTINSAGSGTGIRVTGAGTRLIGLIIDNGTITAPTSVGISVDTQGQVAGDIVNNGALTSAGPGITVRSNGSLIAGAGGSGSIINTGSLTSNSGAGILVFGASIAGGITNTSSGTIAAGAIGTSAGAIVVSRSTIGGSITNSGSITAGSSAAGIGLFSSSVGGNIVNNGSITVGPGGVAIGVAARPTIGALPSAVAGGIVNSGTLTAGSGGGGIIVVGSIVNGGIVNTSSGVITDNGGGAVGIGVRGLQTSTNAVLVSTVNGGITNNGTINVNGPFSQGIAVRGAATTSGAYTGSTVNGGITNNGTINTKGQFSIGIELIGSTVNGGILNAGTINATGRGGVGIGLRPAGNFTAGFTPSTVIGGITNTGTINATGNNGFGIIIQGSRVNNGITNAAGGTINVGPGGVGIRVASLPSGSSIVSFARISGGITNNGTITTTGSGRSASGINTFAAIINGGIINSGTITANGRGGGGIQVRAFSNSTTVITGSTINGGITNTGTINTNGTSGVGIRVAGSTVNNGIANTGTINATGTNGTGIRISGSTINGGVGNSGTINAGPEGYGIRMVNLVNSSNAVIATPTVNGGITNTGTITAGLAAIDTRVDATATVINQNGGAINGPVLLSQTNADVLNIAGGTLNGQITGGAPTILNMTGGTLVVATTFNHVIGSYNQSGGTVSFNVTPNTAPGAYGSIRSLGPASVGGTFNAVEAFGVYAKAQVYQDVFIAPSRTGNFTVTSQSPLFTASLIPGSAGGNESLLLSFTGVPAAGLPPNQQAVASALNSVFGGPLTGNAGLLYGAFFNLTAGQIPAALTVLDGEVHADVQSVLLEDSSVFRTTILDRLRQLPFLGSGGAMAALGNGGPAVAYAEDPRSELPATALGYASAERPSFPIKAPPRSGPIYDSGVIFWSQGMGAWGKLNGDGNANDVTRRLGGFFTGVDKGFGAWRAGIAAGYTNSNLNVSAVASSANIDTAHIGAYGGASFGAFNLRSGAALSFSSVTTNRSIIFPGFADAAGARYNATTGQIFGEIGYGMQVRNWALEPFGGLALVSVRTDGFTEAGGAAALAGAAAKEDVGYSSLGLRAATVYMLQNGMALLPRATVAWQHAFGDVVPAASLAFVAGGAPFTTAGVPIARDAALLEAGFDLRVTLRATLGVAYTGELAGNARDHSVKGTFSWKF